MPAPKSDQQPQKNVSLVDLPGSRELLRWATMSRLVQPFVAPGDAIVAAGATSIFCVYSVNHGIEATLLGLSFYFASLDYKTSPVSVVRVGTDAYNKNNAATGDPVRGGGPFKAALSRDLYTPFMFPVAGIFFDGDTSVALQVTNGETSAYYAYGLLVGISWKADQREQIEEEVTRLGVPWQRGLF